MIVFSSPHHRKWKLPKIRCDFLEPRTLVGSESRTPGIRLRGVFLLLLWLFIWGFPQWFGSGATIFGETLIPSEASACCKQDRFGGSSMDQRWNGEACGHPRHGDLQNPRATPRRGWFFGKDERMEWGTQVSDTPDMGLSQNQTPQSVEILHSSYIGLPWFWPWPMTLGSAYCGLEREPQWFLVLRCTRQSSKNG